MLLVRQAPDPFTAAVTYLTSAGFQSGNLIQVAGTQRRLGGEDVIFIESVRASMLQAAE